MKRNLLTNTTEMISEKTPKYSFQIRRNWNAIIVIHLIFSFYANLTAQNVGINTTGTTPNTTALLDIDATDKGILIPRVNLNSTTDVTTIATPATNLLVFNTNASMTNGNGAGFYYYNGSSWTYMVAPSNGPGTSGEVLTSQGGGNPPEWASSGGGSCLPTQISDTKWSNVNWLTCGSNCSGLSEGGFTDWHVPSEEEYAFARLTFSAPTGGWINADFWTRIPSGGDVRTYQENALSTSQQAPTFTISCRCIR